MSCNGCRALRKGCSESCILRPCLQWIESPQAQAHATVFVARFFGRSDLMSFISAVPESQRPALFQSLLYEACGRTVNPVNGAVGLLWSGNWHLCQAAVETVLAGGALRPIQGLLAGVMPPDWDEASDVLSKDAWKLRDAYFPSKPSMHDNKIAQPSDLRLSPTPRFSTKIRGARARAGTTSFSTDQSVTTISGSGGDDDSNNLEGKERKVLNLFI